MADQPPMYPAPAGSFAPPETPPSYAYAPPPIMASAPAPAPAPGTAAPPAYGYTPASNTAPTDTTYAYPSTYPGYAGYAPPAPAPAAYPGYPSGGYGYAAPAPVNSGPNAPNSGPNAPSRGPILDTNEEKDPRDRQTGRNVSDRPRDTDHRPERDSRRDSDRVDLEGRPGGSYFCRDYSRGRCTRGQDCRYGHPSSESGPVGGSHAPGGASGGFPRGTLPPASALPSLPQPILHPPGYVQPAMRQFSETDDFLEKDMLNNEEEVETEIRTGFFAPAPIAVDEPELALDLEEDEPSGKPLSHTKSDTLGLSEWDISQMTADELVAHIEGRSVRRRVDSTTHAAEEDKGVEEMDLDDLPPLPPLPLPTLPTFIRANKVKDIHNALDRMYHIVQKQESDDVEQLWTTLEADVVLALVEVLRETGLARLDDKPLGFPAMENPLLPPGYVGKDNKVKVMRSRVNFYPFIKCFCTL